MGETTPSGDARGELVAGKEADSAYLLRVESADAGTGSPRVSREERMARRKKKPFIRLRFFKYHEDGSKTELVRSFMNKAEVLLALRILPDYSVYPVSEKSADLLRLTLREHWKALEAEGRPRWKG